MHEGATHDQQWAQICNVLAELQAELSDSLYSICCLTWPDTFKLYQDPDPGTPVRSWNSIWRELIEVFAQVRKADHQGV